MCIIRSVHRKVEERAAINQQQEEKLARQEKEIASLTAAVRQQAAQIQKVNAHWETATPPARLLSTDE